tara:strand:- start:739 stop:915 length:177 start_codon:yes stop_codon:yes gene_type:complete
MNITDAQYIKNEDSEKPHAVNCLVDGVPHCVPMNSDNRHYIEILEQVAAGELTIADAE